MARTITRYRMLTGPDDKAFCERVSQALKEGWQLHGSPSLAYDPDKARIICGQALIRDEEIDDDQDQQK